jgi:hypothetical protein
MRLRLVLPTAPPASLLLLVLAQSCPASALTTGASSLAAHTSLSHPSAALILIALVTSAGIAVSAPLYRRSHAPATTPSSGRALRSAILILGVVLSAYVVTLATDYALALSSLITSLAVRGPPVKSPNHVWHIANVDTPRPLVRGLLAASGILVAVQAVLMLLVGPALEAAGAMSIGVRRRERDAAQLGLLPPKKYPPPPPGLINPKLPIGGGFLGVARRHPCPIAGLAACVILLFSIAGLGVYTLSAARFLLPEDIASIDPSTALNTSTTGDALLISSVTGRHSIAGLRVVVCGQINTVGVDSRRFLPDGKTLRCAPSVPESSAPQSSVPPPSVPSSSGAPSSGAPSSGAPSSGAPSSGVPSSVPTLAVPASSASSDKCVRTNGDSSAGFASCVSGRRNDTGRPYVPLAEIFDTIKADSGPAARLSNAEPVPSPFSPNGEIPSGPTYIDVSDFRTNDALLAVQGFAIAAVITNVLVPILWVLSLHIFGADVCSMTFWFAGIVSAVPLLVSLTAVLRRLDRGPVHDVFSSFDARGKIISTPLTFNPLNVYALAGPGPGARALLHTSAVAIVADAVILLAAAVVKPYEIILCVERLALHFTVTSALVDDAEPASDIAITTVEVRNSARSGP